MRIIKRLTAVLLAAVLLIPSAMPVFAAGTTTKMVDMHEIDGEHWKAVDSITDSYGNSYSSNVLKLDASYDAYISYDLNGRYKSFQGSLVCSTETGSGASMNIGIFADGKLIYEATDITRQQAAKDIELDLVGVGLLEIKTSNTGEDSCGWLFFVNASFEEADTAVSYNEWAKLSDMVAIDTGRGYEYRKALSKDVMGDLHNGAIKFDASYEAYVLYNLDAQYISLKGSFIAFPETGNGADITVNIYADDVKVFSQSGIKKQNAAVDFSIDVTGVKVLKITSSNEGEYDYGRVFLVDDILSKHAHTPGDWEVTTEATCTSAGEKVQTCETCGDIVNREEIPAAGHKADTEWTTAAEATCTEDGEKVQKCTVCGEPVHSESIPATGHTPSGAWEYSDDGTCNKVQHCTVCGEVVERQTDEEAEHSRSGEWIVTAEPKCDEAGERVQYCTICGEVAVRESIPTTEHDYGEWKTTSGSILDSPVVMVRTCSICGETERIVNNENAWVKPLVIALVCIFCVSFLIDM